MGYTTEFSGAFTITPQPLDAETYVTLLEVEPEIDGRAEELFWRVQKDRKTIRDVGVEKWYTYVEQLQWLADFLFAKGYRLEGVVHYGGEEVTDTGSLRVEYVVGPDNIERAKATKTPAVFK